MKYVLTKVLAILTFFWTKYFCSVFLPHPDWSEVDILSCPYFLYNLSCCIRMSCPPESFLPVLSSSTVYSCPVIQHTFLVSCHAVLSSCNFPPVLSFYHVLLSWPPVLSLSSCPVILSSSPVSPGLSPACRIKFSSLTFPFFSCQSRHMYSFPPADQSYRSCHIYIWHFSRNPSNFKPGLSREFGGRITCRLYF